jgi:hypothetical protein
MCVNFALIKSVGSAKSIERLCFGGNLLIFSGFSLVRKLKERHGVVMAGKIPHNLAWL